MARKEFSQLRESLNPRCPLPMNKRRGSQRHHAYMVCIVNMLTEQVLGESTFDADPKRLTLLTKRCRPYRLFSRRMDGAYPSTKNPVAIWEIKEYYGTTTFGSRVADGVYETMLDGHEILEAARGNGPRVLHYLIVDDFYTWWECGLSYLCRIIDSLHMGLVDEVLFGREVLERWPQVVASWRRVGPTSDRTAADRHVAEKQEKDGSRARTS